MAAHPQDPAPVSVVTHEGRGMGAAIACGHRLPSAAAFRVPDDAGDITGETVRVDGGMSRHV